MHVAIIMDGNGRWATARGMPRVAGHQAGAGAVRRVVEAAPKHGVATLTLYAFSADNWKRPESEISALLRLFRHHLDVETDKLVENGVLLEVVGRRDRLPFDLVARIERAEAATTRGARLRLRLAVDYSARDALIAASARLTANREAPTREAFARALAEATHSRPPTPDVDLMIRTGGEKRLSDFLLWECAYAELYFTPRMWPDFDEQDLAGALAEFRRRERRFGGLAKLAVG